MSVREYQIKAALYRGSDVEEKTLRHAIIDKGIAGILPLY
jgi:hypothetical protein